MQQDPTDDKKPVQDPPKKDSAYYIAKYGQYMDGGRDTDKDLAGQTFQDASKPYKDLILDNSKKLGISPEILFASLNEEGVRQMARNNEYSGNDKYPIAGYAHFGLDTFGDAYPNLVKKGYLPDKMDFSPLQETNEKGQKVHSANFKTVDDAIAAKAAMLKDVQDNVDAYAQKRGYNLSDKSKQFFMLAGYNGGLGNAQKMMDSYNQSGQLANDSYLTKKPTSYAGIYDNVMRRIEPANAWRDENIFGDNPPDVQPNVQPVVQPTQPQGAPLYQNGKIIAYSKNGQITAAGN